MASAETDRTVVIEPNVKTRYKIRQQHPDIEFIPLSLRLIKYVIFFCFLPKNENNLK